jgi:hypothetical protein
MNKFIPLLLGLMIPFVGAQADTFTDEAVEFCKSKGGTYSMADMVSEGDKYCRKVTCKKTNTDKYVVEDTDKNAANVEATKQVCVPKSVIDGNFTPAGAQSGSTSGNSSGSTSGNSSGVSSGNSSGATSGNSSGVSSGNSSGSTSGNSSGNSSGVSSGNGNGNGNGSDGHEICVTKTGQRLAIGPNHACYDDCKASGIWPFRKSGLERKSCVECLMGQGYDFDDSVKKKAGVVIVGGVTVTVCRDRNGNEVSSSSSGSCPSGSNSSGTTNVGFGNNGNRGSGSGSGGTSVSVGSGSSGNGGNGGNGTSITIAREGEWRPAYCNSTKERDLELCREWEARNRFSCSHGSSISACTGGASDEIYNRYDLKNCVNCQANMAGGRQQSTLSGIAEIAGALAPVAAVGLGAYFGYKGQQAWANAATAGFEQCRLNQTDYRQQLAAAEMSLSPTQQAQLGCNGFSLNSFAGLGNSGVNGYLGAGYSNGFLGGMMGPYGAYNPYGQGGIVGSAVGGIVGGLASGGIAGGYVQGGYVAGGYVGGAYPGIAGGYVQGGYVGGYPGVAAGAVNGISVAGGIVGGGGYVAGGYVGGYPGVVGGAVQGGYVAGGYPAGIAGGYVQGGYVGGYPGVAAGAVNGISVAGGIVGGGGYVAGGYVGGYPTVAGGYVGGAGGYIAAGQVGGYVNGGYLAGGYAAGGYAAGVAGGYAGGFATGGYAAGGYAAGIAGGYAAGGYAAGGYAAGGYSQIDVQGGNYDRMMQQQGTSFQMTSLGGYGASGYPSNVGVGLGASFGAGGSFGLGF